MSSLVSFEPSAQHAGAFSVAETLCGCTQHSFSQQYMQELVGKRDNKACSCRCEQSHARIVGKCDNKACSRHCEQSHASCVHQLRDLRGDVQESSQACRVLADALNSVCFQLAVQLCSGCCAALHGLPHSICSSTSLRGLPPLQQCNADMQCLT